LFIILFQTVRVRRRIRKSGTHMNSHDSLIFLAKKRLVEGELSIEEFRQIREELKRS
jgi:uncharacterized membrane protein